MLHLYNIPPELKELQEIVLPFYKNFLKPLLPKRTSPMDEIPHEDFYFSEYSPFVAGGYIVDTFKGLEPKDIDLYFPLLDLCQDDFVQYLKGLGLECKLSPSSNYAFFSFHLKTGREVQLISSITYYQPSYMPKVNTMSMADTKLVHIDETFDIFICKTVFNLFRGTYSFPHADGDYLLAPNNQWLSEMLGEKPLTVNLNPEKIFCKDKRKIHERLLKYDKKGFRVAPEHSGISDSNIWLKFHNLTSEGK